MFKLSSYLIAFLLSQATLTTVFADYEMDYPAIRQFIYWVETDNRVALSKHVEYPLSRSHPIPDIENAEEFIERYDEIFDEKLISMIVNSDLGEDWRV